MLLSDDDDDDFYQYSQNCYNHLFGIKEVEKINRKVLFPHSTKITKSFYSSQAINVLSLITMKTSNYRSDLVIHSISQGNSNSILIVS